jgi:uncharacterized protein (TIGR00369 family)
MSDARDTSDLPEVPAERIPSFHHLLGMERMRAGGGRAEISLEVRDEHTNRRGVSHGGVVAALLDAVLGAAVVSSIRRHEWCGTVQLNVQFLEPARGPVLTGRGRMLRRGRRVAFAEGEVVDRRGRTVATAAGTWYVWPSHPEGGTQEP